MWPILWCLRLSNDNYSLNIFSQPNQTQLDILSQPKTGILVNKRNGWDLSPLCGSLTSFWLPVQLSWTSDPGMATLQIHKILNYLNSIDRWCTFTQELWQPLVVFHFGHLPFWSSSILVVFPFSHLPFWSSSMYTHIQTDGWNYSLLKLTSVYAGKLEKALNNLIFKRTKSFVFARTGFHQTHMEETAYLGSSVGVLRRPVPSITGISPSLTTSVPSI